MLASLNGVPMHRRARHLQATTGFPMTNVNLNVILDECKLESGECTSYCDRWDSRWNSTYDCPETEASNGDLSSWDVSSVTALYESKQPLDLSLCRTLLGEGVWSGSNYVCFLDDGCAARARARVCVCCLLYTSPSPRDRQKSRMPSSA